MNSWVQSPPLSFPQLKEKDVTPHHLCFKIIPIILSNQENYLLKFIILKNIRLEKWWVLCLGMSTVFCVFCLFLVFGKNTMQDGWNRTRWSWFFVRSKRVIVRSLDTIMTPSKSALFYNTIYPTTAKNQISSGWQKLDKIEWAQDRKQRWRRTGACVMPATSQWANYPYSK